MYLGGVSLLSVVIFLCHTSYIFGQQFDSCLPNEKPCRNGQCIAANLFCNRYADCDDGSDETECYGLQMGNIFYHTISHRYWIKFKANILNIYF